MSKYIKIKKILVANDGLYGAMSNAQVAVELNALNKSTNKKVEVEEIESYLFQQGVYDKIISLGNVAGSAPETLAGKAIGQIFSSKKSIIDVNHTSFQGGLDAIVSSNTITQDQADAIKAMGKELKSTTQIEGLSGTLYEEDIRIARAN